MTIEVDPTKNSQRFVQLKISAMAMDFLNFGIEQ